MKAIKSQSGTFLTLKEAKVLTLEQTKLLLQYIECLAKSHLQTERDKYQATVEDQLGKVMSSWEMVGQLTDPEVYLAETFDQFKETVEIVEVPDDFDPNIGRAEGRNQ